MVSRRIEVRGLLGLLAVAVIWVVAIGATQLAHGRAVVAAAAAFDLSVTSAVALYLIAVRSGGPYTRLRFRAQPLEDSGHARSPSLPRWVIPVCVTLGLVVARVVLGHTPGVGNAVMITAALIDLVMFVVLIIGARRAVRSWRTTRTQPLLDRIDAALGAVGFPRLLARLAATEVTLVVYAFAGWRTPRRSATRFTVHRTGGWPAYAGVLIFLTFVETAAVHIAVASASTTAAWVITIASLYSALWILGDVHALRHGGVTFGRDALELALGVRWSGTIPYASIASVERGRAPDDPGVIDVSILGANVVLHLRTPCALRGLFGRRREAMQVALSIDDLDAFIRRLETT